MRETPLILVVDDDPGIQDLVRDILTTSYRVVTVSSVKEAQKYLRSQGGCDLVLTDMIMPAMGGMELVQYLRLHHPETLVIVFTGYAILPGRGGCREAGGLRLPPQALAARNPAACHRAGPGIPAPVRPQKDLETVFQGAEALGWQALDLVSATEEPRS